MNSILTPRKIANIYNGQQHEKIRINDVMAILLQISIALLMVFFIADLLFRSQTKAALEEAKNKMDIYQKKVAELDTTEVGQQYKLREEALIKSQKQKLINALEKVETQDRERLGLSVFSRVKNDKSVEFFVEGILSGDKITDNPVIRKHFIEGCKFAKENLPFQGKMENNWLLRVLSESGTEIEKGPVLITEKPDILSKDNQIWLMGEIRKRLKAVHADCLTLQGLVFSQLQSYYQTNVEMLRDTEIYPLINEYRSALSSSPRERERLIGPIREGIYEYAKSVFEEQGIFLLSGI